VLVALDPTFSELGRRLLPEALALPLTLASIWLLLRTRRRGRWIDATAAGVSIGLLVLARVNMVALLPGAMLLLIWPGRRRWPKRLAQTAMVFLLAVLCWLPVPIRQQQLSGQWHWMPSQGAGMLVVGNIPSDATRRLAYHDALIRWARENVPEADRLREDVIAFADNALLRSTEPTKEYLLWDPLPTARLQRINPYLTRFMVHYATAHGREFFAGVVEKLSDFWWTNPSKGEHFRVHTILFLLAMALWLAWLRNVRVSAIMLMIAATCGLLVLSYFEERHRSPVVPMIDVLAAGALVWRIIKLRRAAVAMGSSPEAQITVSLTPPERR
jgi:4-amino-4-deoxy-L-arabinose transferase-like glycosyltransferase